MLRRSTATFLEREGGGLVALTFLVCALFAVLPLGRLLIAALGPADVALPWSGAEKLMDVLARRSTLNATTATLLIAVVSGVASLLLGLFVVLLLAITNVPGKRLIAFLFVLSLMVAPQVAALAFKTLSGPASPLLNALGLAPKPGSGNPMLSYGGIIFVMALHHAPLAAITIAPGLRAIPRSLIEAAQIDGANPWAITRSIVLPLLRPYLLAASLLVFVAGVGNFGIPALLGMPVNIVTLPTLVYQSLSSFGSSVIGDAARVSLLVAGIAGLGVLGAAVALRRTGVPLEPEAAMQPFWLLGPVSRIVVLLALWLVIAICVLLPLTSLIATSLVPAYGVTLTWETLTIDRFAEVLIRQDVTRRAFLNSLVLAGGAALLLAVMSVLIAYALVRLGGRWRGLVEPLIEMPYALPGVVLAIACILLFVQPLPLIGVSIYATPLIILLAYLFRFLPLALKSPLAAMSQLSREQEEAAAVFGASLGQRLVYVVIPTLAPAAAAGALLAFLLAFNELTVSALLWSAGTETLGVALLSLEDAGLGSEAAAVGVSATIIVGVIMALLDLARQRLPADVLPWIALTGTPPLPR